MNEDEAKQVEAVKGLEVQGLDGGGAAGVDRESGSRPCGPITGLADMGPDVILGEIELARALDVCPRTLRRMVSRHELPPPIRLAGKSRWLAGRVLEHIRREAERKEKEAERELARIRRI